MDASAGVSNPATTSISPPPQSSPTQPPPKESSTTTSVSPLNNIPADIATHRALLFALDTPVQLTPAVWDRFWPYIDNVWCVHQKPVTSQSTGIAKVYGACRLNRKTNFPTPEVHEKSRPRQRREGGTCKAKFRLTIYPDGKKVVERTGEAHSHTLEHIDSIKRNSGVRNLVLDDFFKSWEAGGILAYLRDTSSNPTPTATTASPSSNILNDAGGLYLSRQEAQNILNSALKKAYPGQDVSDIKKQMDKYKNYTTCNFKGCNAPAFPGPKELMEHRKTVHGLRAHDHSDKVYKCPDKACWRRKKSKGFATLLGLEEHMREKHGGQTGSIAPQETVDSSLDPVIADQMSDMNMPLLNIGIMGGLLTDPITPESSIEDQDISLPVQDVQAVAEPENVLSHTEKETMKLRIKRLQIERQKLDQEIKRLNKAVYGDERGELVADTEAG